MLVSNLIFEHSGHTLKRLFFDSPTVRKAVVVLGVPGAGKSTQLAALEARRGWPGINFGRAVRSLATGDTPLAKGLARWRADGSAAQRTKWLPDDLSAQIFREQLPSHGSEVVLLDGYPRKRAQSLELETNEWHLLTTLSLTLSRDEQLARLATRAATERTTADLATRMQDWSNDTVPLLEHYRKRGPFDEVDATEPAEVVTREIEKIVEARLFDLVYSFVPDEARLFLEGFTPTKVNLSKKYRVYRFSRDLEERYLKVIYEPAARNPSSYEGPILATVKALGFPFATPVVHSYFGMGPEVNGVISERVPGITLKEAIARELMPARSLAAQWAQALARIHRFVPTQPERFVQRPIGELVALARQRLVNGVIKPYVFSAKYGVAPGFDPARELETLGARIGALTFEQVRLNHGDPCAPNFIWSAEAKQISGCVDLSGICFTDVHWDMSIALWSLGHNTQRVSVAEFIGEYTAFGGERIDLEKLDLMYRLARFLL